MSLNKPFRNVLDSDRTEIKLFNRDASYKATIKPVIGEDLPRAISYNNVLYVLHGDKYLETHPLVHIEY